MSKKRTQSKYLIRRAVALLVVLGILASIFYSLTTLFAPVPKSNAKVEPLDSVSSASVKIPWPKYGLAGFSELSDQPIMLQSSGKLDEKHAIASITKLIVALVVLEKKPMTPSDSGAKITLSSSDLEIYYNQIAQNGSVMPAAEGWKFSQREILELVLISSANNYSDTLASWAFGSQTKFLEEAKSWLNKNGLKNTKIVDSSGISDKNVSTVADLMILARLALANPVIAEIVDLEQKKVPHLGTIENTNPLLGKAKNQIGIKTGTGDAAGSCLLFASQHTIAGETFTLIGVVLGGDTRSKVVKDIQQIQKAAVANIQSLAIIDNTQAVAKIETLWGETASIFPAQELRILVYGAVTFSPEITIDEIQTAKAGQRVGSISYFSDDGKQILQTDLLIDKDLNGPDAWWRLTNPDKLW